MSHDEQTKRDDAREHDAIATQPSDASHQASSGIRQVVLVGLPGVGKTTVGEMLAKRAGLDFVDADDYLEQREGRLITEIFRDEGEQYFRTVEAEVTCELLAREGVIALGGGAVTNPTVRDALHDATVVWLTESIGQGIVRIGTTTHRPLMHGDVAQTLRKLKSERDPLYRQVATHSIDTNRKRPRKVVREIQEVLGWEQEDA